MALAASDYCDVCKTYTSRCQYYPKGRSRQHGTCLECSRNDQRNSGGFQSSDRRYCYQCDRNRIAEKNGSS